MATDREWIVVLGASSGFGAATARAFAAQGYGIFGVHLDRQSTMPQVESLIAELRSFDVPVVFANTNAADDDKRTAAIDVLAESLKTHGGTVKVLLHSIAFGTLRPYFGEDATLKRRQMEMTLDVMAHSLVYWTQDLVERGFITNGGRVYAMTSAGSIAMWPSYGAVSAAKCALESHIRQIAIELAPQGITANAIMAGVTQTPALDKIPGADKIAETALSRNPSGRLTKPEDIANCLVALAGEGTNWLTGNVLKVDGGESVSG